VTGQPADAELREIVAGLMRDPGQHGISDDTPLLRDGAGLDSLGATILLAEVARRFGVDVAAEDLNLDCLATFGSLAAFIAARRRGPPPRPG
jgi:acyl carrier protein